MSRLAWAALLCAGCSKPADTGVEPSTDVEIALVDVGFENPESMIHDPVADVYLVTNLGGFISRVSPDGEVLALRWADGLTSPKGTAIDGRTLHFVDGPTVKSVDLDTGALLATVEIPDAIFLNDVAVGADGALYVTQRGTGAEDSFVYRIEAGAVSVLAGWPVMDRPNGIAASPDGLIVVGKDEPVIFALDLAGARTELFDAPAIDMDGVVRLDDGALWVAFKGEGTVEHFAPDGVVTRVVEGVLSPADIGWDAARGRLLVPQLSEGAVRILPVTTPGESGD